MRLIHMQISKTSKITFLRSANEPFAQLVRRLIATRLDKHKAS